jgi:predicted phage replisome organizer
MGENRRFYWLKLHKDFFNSVRIKKLRAVAGGDTFTIIYLKLLLLSMDTDGVIEYQGVEDSFSKELALALNEDPDNVEICLKYLWSVKLAEIREESKEIFFPEAVTCTGSEGSSAKRMRDLRSRQQLSTVASNRIEASHCDSDVTKSDVEKRREDKETEKEKSKRKTETVGAELVDDKELWFSEFWKLYPRHVAKANAEKAFKKKCTSEKVYTAIMAGLQNYVTACKGKDPQYIAHPATWLNGERWNDEVTTKTKSSNPFLDMLNGME